MTQQNQYNPHPPAPTQGPIASTQVLCPQCGYNLTGASIGGKCPECGRQIDYSAMAQRGPSTGLAIASLVLGIIALVSSPIIFISIIFVLIGVGLGIGALVKIKNGTGGGKGMALTGLVCSVLGLVLTITITAFYVMAVQSAVTQFQGIRTRAMATQTTMANKQMQTAMQQAMNQQGLTPQQQALAQQVINQQLGPNAPGNNPGSTNPNNGTTPGSGATPAGKTPTPVATPKVKPAPEVAIAGAVTLSNKLPLPISMQEATDLDFKDKMIESGHMFLEQPQQYPSRSVRCDSILELQDHRLVRIKAPYSSLIKVFGKTDLGSERFQSFWLEDASGTEVYAIGYVLNKSNRNLYINIDRDFIETGSDLPLNKMDRKDSLYIYFSVPKGVKIEALKVGNPGARSNPVSAQQTLSIDVPAR
jgi:hypothetical protein